MIVREALVSDPRVLQANTAVREAAELLTRPNVESALVADGERLVGCVTRESIVEAVARGVDLSSATVADVCERDVTTIGPDVALDKAVRAFYPEALDIRTFGERFEPFQNLTAHYLLTGARLAP